MRHVSTQKRDSHFINNFRRLFGAPSDDLVIIWGQNYRQTKTFKKYVPTTYAETSKKMLLRNGYRVFEVNENYTSQLCYVCKQVMAPARGLA
jgi:hypothetical protein